MKNQNFLIPITGGKKGGAMFGMFVCLCLCMTLSPGLLISALPDLDLKNYYQSPLILSGVFD